MKILSNLIMTLILSLIQLLRRKIKVRMKRVQ